MSEEEKKGREIKAEAEEKIDVEINTDAIIWWKVTAIVFLLIGFAIVFELAQINSELHKTNELLVKIESTQEPQAEFWSMQLGVLKQQQAQAQLKQQVEAQKTNG